MSTITGVGCSLATQPGKAGREAAALACSHLRGLEPDLCLVFGTCGYDQSQLLEGVRSVAPGARISGCTGEGVIAGRDSIERDRVVAVLAVRSDVFSFEPFLVDGYGADPERCGRELARRVAASGMRDALGLLVFPDGLVGDCTRMLRVLEEQLPAPVPIGGGSAGDAMTFERTWQYHDGCHASDSVAAVLVRGRGQLDIQVSHGCHAIGLPRLVTDADGGWLRSIDGKPAWSVFREYLDGEPDDLNAEGMAHLSLAEELASDERQEYGGFIIRTPLQLDRATGALFFPGGGIATSTLVRMARRDSQRIRDSARRCAARIAARQPGARPAFVLQFDCAGRGRMLFGSGVADEIVRPLQEELGTSVPWIGIHTYGEIAPIAGRAYYHNYTVALCALYEHG